MKQPTAKQKHYPTLLLKADPEEIGIYIIAIFAKNGVDRVTSV